MLLHVSTFAPRTDAAAIDELLLARGETRVDFLDVRRGDEALAIVDLHLPPVLVIGVEEREDVALLHRDFSRGLFRVVVQGHDALFSRDIGDRGLLLPAVGSLLPKQRNVN